MLFLCWYIQIVVIEFFGDRKNMEDFVIGLYTYKYAYLYVRRRSVGRQGL